MGVEPFLTGSAVTGVLAQRLARKPVHELLRDVHPDDGGAADRRLSPETRPQREGMALYRKVGCRAATAPATRAGSASFS